MRSELLLGVNVVEARKERETRPLPVAVALIFSANDEESGVKDGHYPAVISRVMDQIGSCHFEIGNLRRFSTPHMSENESCIACHFYSHNTSTKGLRAMPTL